MEEGDEKTFDDLGFVILKKRISPDSISKGRDAFKRMLQKCESNMYPFVRQFNGNAFNQILGIEHLFHPEIFESSIFTIIQESQCAEMAQNILKEDISLFLNRLICTQKVSFNGAWHRDGAAGVLKHVQFAIPLFDEDGFFIIPQSHKIEDDTLGFDFMKNYPCSKKLPNQMRISISPGDVLVFHSSILHRGSCRGYSPFERAHIHLRIGRTSSTQEDYSVCQDEFMKRGEVLNMANTIWKDIIRQNPDLKCYRQSVKKQHPKFITKKIYEALYHLSKYYPKSLDMKYLDCRYLR